MGCHALLQGIFRSRGWNLRSNALQVDSSLQSHWGPAQGVESLFQKPLSIIMGPFLGSLGGGSLSQPPLPVLPSFPHVDSDLPSFSSLKNSICFFFSFLGKYANITKTAHQQLLTLCPQPLNPRLCCSGKTDDEERQGNRGGAFCPLELGEQKTIPSGNAVRKCRKPGYCCKGDKGQRFQNVR